MRCLLVLLALAVLPLSGCQSTPPSSGGVVYGPPCGYKAFDAGMCPYIGYRKPITL